jgi:putative transposase
MNGKGKKFLDKVLSNNLKPRVINIDKSGANTPGILAINKRSIWSIPNIGIRRVKYLFNIDEHDQRAIKRGMSIPTECKEFESAQRTKLEILMHLGLILSNHWRCEKQTSTEFL